MTLLDAPRFDEAGDRRKRLIAWLGVGSFTALVIVFWIVSGFPIDWPWNWWTHMRGRAVINAFFKDVERNDLNGAYVVWIHDRDWQQQQAQFAAHPFEQFQSQQKQAHPNIDARAVVRAYGDLVHDHDWQRHAGVFTYYPLSRFEEDWGPASPDNEYGPIKSHYIAAARMNGNVLVAGIYVNGRRSKPVFLAYDPKQKTLSASNVELYLQP
jgi:hypothetical protein